MLTTSKSWLRIGTPNVFRSSPSRHRNHHPLASVRTRNAEHDPGGAGVMTKRCGRCGEWKPLEAFNLNRAAAVHGRQSRCRPCQVIGNREWAERTGNRRYFHDPEAQAKRREKAGRLFPERRRAGMAVARAVRSGKLVRPDCCEKCGANPGLNRAGWPLIYAHHEDYAKALEVTWLCSRCHARHHWLRVTDASRQESAA